MNGDTLAPPADPLRFVRMGHPDLDGEEYADRDAYRAVWYAKGYRSVDDPGFVGGDPAAPSYAIHASAVGVTSSGLTVINGTTTVQQALAALDAAVAGGGGGGGGGGLTQEQVEDVVGAMVTDNVETGIAVSYNDNGEGVGKLNFAAEVTQDMLDAVEAGAGDVMVVAHGADADVARPDAPVVLWIGTVTPANGTTTDLEIRTDLIDANGEHVHDDLAIDPAEQPLTYLTAAVFGTPITSVKVALAAVDAVVSVNAQRLYNTLTRTVTTSGALVLTDRGRVVRANSASTVTLTIPPIASVAYAVGDIITVRKVGTGAVAIALGTGVTFLDGSTSLTLAARKGATVGLEMDASNVWNYIGEVA